MAEDLSECLHQSSVWPSPVLVLLQCTGHAYLLYHIWSVTLIRLRHHTGAPVFLFCQISQNKCDRSDSIKSQICFMLGDVLHVFKRKFYIYIYINNDVLRSSFLIKNRMRWNDNSVLFKSIFLVVATLEIRNRRKCWVSRKV